MAMDLERTAMEHGERLASAEKGIDILEKIIPVLFRDIREVKALADKAVNGIESIKGKLDNGLIAEMAELKKSIESAAKEQGLVDKELGGQITAAVKGQADADRVLETQINRLDHDSWFLKILNMGVSKALASLVTIVFLGAAGTALMSNMGYSYLKEYKFQEMPGQLKSLTDMHQQGYHYHKLSEDEYIFHTGNDKFPAFIINMKTGRSVPAPEHRTDANLPPPIIITK